MSSLEISNNVTAPSLGDSRDYLFSPRPTYGQDNNVWKKLDVELAAANYSREFRLLVTHAQ